MTIRLYYEFAIYGNSTLYRIAVRNLWRLLIGQVISLNDRLSCSPFVRHDSCGTFGRPCEHEAFASLETNWQVLLGEEYSRNIYGCRRWHERRLSAVVSLSVDCSLRADPKRLR